MSSRILIRLIDEAIVPALLVLLAKIIGILVLIQGLGLDWKFDPVALIPRIMFEGTDIVALVNTYSNLTMVAVAMGGLVWVLVRAYHFHDTHMQPSMVLQLLSWNMTGIIATSEQVYQQALVWLSLLWFAIAVMALQTLIGVNYGWSFAIAFFSGLFATWLMVADIERELQHT